MACALHQRFLSQSEKRITEGEARPLLALRETSGEAKTFSLLPNRVIAILPIRIMGLAKSWIIVVG